jgi:hypothetical protein
MKEHLDQASHNADFHACLVDKFSTRFFDWKITVLFYEAIHYLQALADKRGIDIGQTHKEIHSNVNPNSAGAKMRITSGAWREYSSLFNYSLTSRYSGITDKSTFELLMENDHGYCLKHLENFKKYICSQAVPIPGVTLTVMKKIASK